METVCFYFRVHQPFRLREYDFSMIGEDHVYEAKDTTLFSQIADEYYLPNNSFLLKLIQKYKKDIKIVFAMSGCAVEQLALYRPDVLVSFQKLAKTGKVEFLEETYYHSLSFLYSATEFERQIKKHHDKMKGLFGKQPTSSQIANSNHIYTDYQSFSLQHLSTDFPTLEILMQYIGADRLSTPQPLTGNLAEEGKLWWIHNSMQKEAIKRVYSLEERVLKSKNENSIDTWGRLQTSDYFYYMSTEIDSSTSDSHKKYNPYGSPFDAYINYMNIISDFENML